MRHQSLALIVLASVGLIGCGGRSGTEVFGKITYKGKQVPMGTLFFFQEDKAAGQTPIQEDGTYRITDLPRGAYKVVVMVVPPPPPEEPKDPGKEGLPPPPPPPDGKGGLDDDPALLAKKMTPEMQLLFKGKKVPDKFGKGYTYVKMPAEQLSFLLEVHDKYGNPGDPRVEYTVVSGKQEKNFELH